MSRVALACGLLLLAATARGDAAATTAIPADRFRPAIGPGLLSVESAVTPGFAEVWWMTGLGWVHHPLTLRLTPRDTVLSRPVADAAMLYVGAEVGLPKNLAIDVLWPVVLYQSGDRLRGTGLDDAPLQAASSGDFIIRGKAAFAGDPTRPGLHLGISLELTLPFGGWHGFAGERSATGALLLHGDFRHRWFGVAAELGYRLKAERQLFGTRFGDEIDWGLGVVATVWPGRVPRVAVVVEAAGIVGPSASARPAELRGAVRFAIGALSFDVGAGGALNHAATAPKARLFVTIRGATGRRRW